MDVAKLDTKDEILRLKSTRRYN